MSVVNLRDSTGSGTRYLTSESVTEGHPDKMADQISDAILDAILGKDPTGRVACETLLTTGCAIVAGEITTTCYVDIAGIVRTTIRDIGYVNADWGFDADSGGVLVAIQEQSGDIAQGVDKGGAGDQGMMFGFACRETPELMPAPIMFAHRLTKRLAQVRKEGILPYLRPDGKSQVTVQYDGDKPVRVDTVVIAAQHEHTITQERIREDVIEHVVKPALPAEMLDDKVRYFVNPTGRFVIGGPRGDTGLTGRKVMVDTYGGLARHGGGCFSGKDPTKVDRSASYMMRYLAKNIVAAGLAERCELQVAYAIGEPQPVSLAIETFGTETVDPRKILEAIRENFDLSPGGIIDYLDLRRPIYRRTAAYGHFGRSEPEFTWERLDCVELLKEATA